MKSSPPTAATSRAILKFLKLSGPSDAAAMARSFKISAMAVRQHLYSMQEAKLICYQEHRRPMGRPAKLWRLTDRAQKMFPDAHAELTANLIELAAKAFGSEGIQRMLELRTRGQIESYREEIPADAPIQKRLTQLRAIRDREGYMAEIKREKDGSFLFVENHCPICSAAKTCSGFCSAELEVFQQVMGPKCRVERTEHLLSGARRCAYRVMERGSC